jgi:hypothetical protein
MITKEQLDDIEATFAHEPIATMDEEYIEATVRRLLTHIAGLADHNHRMKVTLNTMFASYPDLKSRYYDEVR